MPAAPLLDHAEIAARLASRPSWHLENGRLTQSLTTRDFRSALELVYRIADPADEQNHQPLSTRQPYHCPP